MNTKTLYFIKHIALLALFAVGLMLVPNVGTAAAQKQRADREVATTAMLSYALNLKSLTNVAVSGETVSDKGISSIGNGYRIANGPDGDGVSRRDLANVFSAINQLPCSEVAGSELGGKSFMPGVYCLSSADLTSRLVLDAQNNPGAVFVFRTKGALNAKSGASIGLENEAMAANVFFVSDDTASIGEGVDFKGNIIARNRISVGADAMVDGRVISVKGAVELSGNSILGPQQTGVLEICKAVDATAGGNIANRIFRFQLGDTGVVAEVPAGQCSGPLTVPTGNLVVTELQTGRATDGSTFNGNFQLIDVRQLNNPAITPNPVVATNLPAFQATIAIREGTIANQTRIQFTNRFAITAIVEICKEALDSGVTGFFNFTINELRDANGALIPFTVPVGQCTGPIAVVVASDILSGPPRTGTVTVNELPRTGFIFTSATTAVGTTAPANRLVGFNVLANGGGNATVTVVAGTNGGIDTTGATAAQTTVFFNNRTAPATLKVCKIAGPGVPELTPFTFTVTGTAPLAPITTATTVPVGGTAATGATLPGGTATTQNVTVLAGPAGNGAALAGNGFCQVVPGTFVVDTTATVTETGPLTIGGSDVRVTRITSSSGIVSATATAPNPPTFGLPGGTAIGSTPFTLTTAAGTSFYPLTGGANTGTVRAVTVPIVRELTEVEFVNIAFAPAPLKICKVAGTGVAVGTPFSFTVAPDRVNNLLASFSSTVTVQAGPAATGPGTQNGFCDFAPGPFTGAFGGVAGGAVINGLNSFNVGSMVVVTESANVPGTTTPTGTTVTAITSPTAPVVANNTARTATITSIINGVNEVQFVNTVVPPGGLPTIGVKSRKRARFSF